MNNKSKVQNAQTLRTLERRRNQQKRCRQEALEILGISSELASPAIHSFDFYKYALLLNKLKTKFDETNYIVSESNSIFEVTLKHNGRTYVGQGYNKIVAFSNVFSALVLYDLKISEENLCITSSEENVFVKSKCISSLQISKYTQFYMRLTKALKPTFIGKTGTEIQPIFTYSIKYATETIVGIGQSKDFGTYDAVTNTICFKLAVPFHNSSKPLSARVISDSIKSSNKINKVQVSNGNVKNTSNDNVSDFLKIMAKPRQMKFCKSKGPTTQNQNGKLFTMHITVDKVKYSGTCVSRTKSDVIAALSAFNAYTKYHSNSNNDTYESIVHELYEQMRNFIKYEYESEDGKICTTIDIKGELFEGYGANESEAYKYAVATALSKFYIESNASNMASNTNTSVSKIDLTQANFNPPATSSLISYGNKINANEFNNGHGSAELFAKLEALYNAIDYCKNPTLKRIDSQNSVVAKVDKNGGPIEDLCKRIGERDGPIEDLCKRFSSVVFGDAVKMRSNGPDILFKTIINVNGKKFEGSGSSKKLSKTSAAISALSQLCNVNYDSHSETAFIPNNTDLPQHFADKIAKLVYNKFDNITSKSIYNNRKVIAGIVMTKNGDINNAQIIAVATGTKIINGLHLSNYGSVINDSHAEIIARRCLVNYLYSELELHMKAETAERSIFLKPAKPGKYFKLKNEIKFHLFINSTPCGDAANFNPNDEKLNGAKSFESRKLDGQLRAKIESSEGTLPITKNKIQTWDGILQSERLLTMSCSDKIARWNVLGIQGSLLSTIIEPIYFDTIIIGRLYRKKVASRAFWERLESTLTSDLPINYKLNKPKLSETTFRVDRGYAKSPEYSVNWIINEKDFEVINARTGKIINTDNASRLAKKSFFSKYQNIMRNLPNARELYHVVGGTYYKTKQAAEDYQIAKKELFDAFKKNELGYWLVKPPEQNQFMPV